MAQSRIIARDVICAFKLYRRACGFSAGFVYTQILLLWRWESVCTIATFLFADIEAYKFLKSFNWSVVVRVAWRLAHYLPAD